MRFLPVAYVFGNLRMVMNVVGAVFVAAHAVAVAICAAVRVRSADERMAIESLDLGYEMIEDMTDRAMASKMILTMWTMIVTMKLAIFDSFSTKLAVLDLTDASF